MIGKATAVLATLKTALLTVVGVFASLLTPGVALVAVVGLVVAAFAALLVGTEQGRAVLAATGRLIKEGVVFAFNLLRDALEGAWEWTKTFSAGLIDMIPQVVLDSLDSMAKTIGGWADAIGRTNDLSQLTRDLEGLAEGGRLTGEALETVARQAIALRDQGKLLTDELTDVVARFEEMQREAAHLKSMLDALSQVTSLDYLSTVTLQLAESGQTSSEVMKVIAQRAQELQPEGEALSEVLQRVVNAYGEAATAGKGFGDNTGDAGPPVKALSDEVQALVDQFQGRGLIQSALKAAEAVRHVGGVSKLTADDQDQLRETVEGAIDAYRRLGQTAPPAVSALADEIGALADETERLGREQRTRASEGAFAYARAQGAVNRVMESNRLAAVRAQFATHLQTQAHVEATDATFDFERDLGHLRQTMEQGIETAGNMEITLAALAGQLGGAAGQAFNLATAMLEHNRAQDEAARLGEQTSEQFGKIRIGAAIAGAALQTLGDAIGGTAGAILSEVGNIATAFASGGVVGAVIAGIGAAIKGLKALFSVSQAEKDARAFADAYADTIIKTLTTSQLAEAADAALGAWRGNERGAQFLIGVRDGFVAAGRSAAEAEQLVGRYWKAVRDGSPEAVKAIEAQIDAVVKVGQAVQELQAFDSATDQLQQLTSAAEFFGVAAEEMGARLGNAFQAVEQAATAEDIAQHFHTLLASGVDLGTALDLAKDKVQGVIAASVQMGTEIPASMQPIAAQLIAQGQLLDDSGQKITDINQLEFGTSMTEGLQILVLSMNQLVETMGGEIPAAAKQFAEGVGQSATAAGASLDQQLLAQIANIGLAVHDLSVEDLAQMAAAFEATAQAAGLSLEGVLGEQLDALTTGLGSMSRDALPELVRSFQQTATDAVQAFDRIPRTLTFEHRTRYSSSGLPGATTRSGFQSGTAGRFVDFGVGTAVVLHGRERVVTEAEGRREAADLGALRQELADLKRVMARDQDELPFRLSRAIRDAMAETV